MPYPKIVSGSPNNFYKNNKANRSNNKLFLVPITTVFNYFKSYENLYFLALSIFQLLTLNILPAEWSPTGPYSTAIPLLFCVLLEIATNIYKWARNYKLDYLENTRNILAYPSGSLLNSKIQVGHIIILNSGDIIPVDGILLDCPDKYGKISLAPLNGESQTHVVEKLTSKFLLSDLVNCVVDVTNYYPTNYNNLEANIITNSSYKIDGSYFIVSNAIAQSDGLVILVIRCGEEKKSWIKSNTPVRINRLDKYYGDYMINFNGYLLVVLIALVSLIKLYWANYINPIHGLLVLLIQNWILFNGIIPFSVKIFLILVRNIQASWLSKLGPIQVNTPNILDDINKIDIIISDKTGTITKNELEFSKLIQRTSTKVYDIDDNFDITLDLEFITCLGVCIHQTDRGEYSTIEDKTIRYRYSLLGNKITQKDNIITLTFGDTEKSYSYIELSGLDFTFTRRMSSKIVRDNKAYYIYSKGSLDTIKERLCEQDKQELTRLDNLISQQCPELRLLACAYREVNPTELLISLEDSQNRKHLIQSLENNLRILGIIGIRDNLQPQVLETIQELQNNNIQTALCTGDRKITALAVAKEAGIIRTYNETQDFDFTTDQTDKILLINSIDIQEAHLDVSKKAILRRSLLLCRSFVGYNLRPTDKRKLTKILENANKHVLNIGDGFNDISMFESGSISVAIRNNSFVESSADFIVANFSNLRELVLKIGPSYYYKNSLLANYTFYRSILVVVCLVAWCLINYDQATTSLFNGFVLQAFHLLWCSTSILYYVLNLADYGKLNIIKANRLIQDTSRWNISGVLTGAFITLLTWWYYYDNNYLGDILAMIAIICINFKLVFHRFVNKNKLICLLIGPMLFLLYSIYAGSLLSILLVAFNWLFIIKLVLGLVITNLIF